MSDGKHKSLADRIVHAGIIVSIAHLCLKFTGIIQVKAQAYFLESEQYEVLYVAAFQGVIWTIFLVGEEVIGPAFLPVFMREFDDKGEKEAWDFANILLTLQLIILLIAATVVACFPEVMISIFTKWTPEKDPEQYGLLKQYLPLIAPSLICLSIGSTTYMILNGYKKFFLAAFGDASWKICVVIALLLGMGVFGMDHRVLVFGFLIGSVLKLLTHLAGLLGKLHFIRPSLNFKNPALRAMLLLMLPLLTGIIFAKFRDVFNNVRILTHLEQHGVLQANDFGRKLFASLQWLVPYALQIALFPFLCELVDRNDRQRLGDVLSTSCRLLMAVFVPGAILLAVLAKPLAVILFLGGKTGLQVALWSGLSTACYILVLPAAAIECVIMQGYFADRKMVSVTVIGILFSLISVVISYVFIVVLACSPVQALVVVSLGFVISRCFKSLVLTIVLRRSVPMFPLVETTSFLVRLGILGAVVGGMTWLCYRSAGIVLPDGLAAAEAKLAARTVAEGVIELRDASGISIDRIRMLIKLALAGAAGGLTFLGGAYLLRVREPFTMIGWALEKANGKFRRRKAA